LDFKYILNVESIELDDGLKVVMEKGIKIFLGVQPYSGLR
jgi:hypothetical protein